jgi:hypothetical protein
MTARRLAWTLGGALAIVVLWLAWRLGNGPLGLAYAGAWLLATAPGWPIGWRLFGRDHAAGWICGALLGYALTAWAIWAVTAAGLTWPAERLGAWAVLTALTWITLARGRREPIVALPPWTAGNTIALVLVLAMVPALVGRPFLKVGSDDGEGGRQYRAYFTADVVWHAALTAELRRFSLPARNPYTADRPLHYYFTYFLVPAAIIESAPAFERAGPFPWLLINAIGAGSLFIGVLFLAAWVTCPRPVVAAASTALVALCASAEGVWFLWRLWATGGPLAATRDTNIDAVTRLVFQGLTIDNLPRSLWYTPQHAGACALGLVALVIAIGAGPAAPLAALAAAGLAIGAALTFSPLLGGLFAVIYGLSVIARAIAENGLGGAIRLTVRHALVAAMAAAAVAALFAASMVDGAGDALHIGFVGYARNSPAATLALALGPVLALGLPAFWPRAFPQTLWPAAIGFAGGVLLFLFASLPDRDPIWVGWRAGQLMLVSLPALVARTTAWLTGLAPRLAAIPLVLAALVGLPTTIIDAVNAQDVGNRNMGAAFRLTVIISKAEQEALTWLRTTTQPSAIVQPDVQARGQDTWTLIPTFAERRMFAGLPISLLYEPEYTRRAAAVAAAFDSRDAIEASRMLKTAGVDYLYVGDAERRAHAAAALAKFDHAPERFERVFQNAAVTIYALH